MTDRYVYYFKGLPGSAAENTLSMRPATLAAIKGRGEPIMESQIVVDHTELDTQGFLNPYVGKGSYRVNDLEAQIGSLELRALARDREALKLNDTSEGKDKYMLRLESRELRLQEQKLRKLRDDLVAQEHGASEILESVHWEGIQPRG